MLLISFLILLLLFFYLVISKKITVPFLYHLTAWSDVTLGTLFTKNPLEIDTNDITHINPFQFKINPPARFMADPFIVEDNGVYYIFFEQISFKMNAKGADIAVLKSDDLINWKHLGVVLREPHHLSYPNVFKWEGGWYMIPETLARKEVLLYESSEFPFKWKLKTVIINKPVLDPTLIIKDKVLYMLGRGIEDDSLRVYFSDDLFSGWVEHKSSPIRKGENETQPAGKPGWFDGKLIYFVQDHTDGYGTGVIAYEIVTLTKDVFLDKRMEANPVLYKHGKDWAELGMHHISWIKTHENKYFCVVDGINAAHKKQWKFNIRNFPVFTNHL